MYKRKRIYLTHDRSKFCTVYFFKKLKDMQAAYKKYREDGDDILGAFCPYTRILDDETISADIGRMYLCMEYSGAGLVSHEIMHGIMWAWNHGQDKERYPVVIQTMEEEETMLHNLTMATRQFYSWYWRIEKFFK